VSIYYDMCVVGRAVCLGYIKVNIIIIIIIIIINSWVSLTDVSASRPLSACRRSKHRRSVTALTYDVVCCVRFFPLANGVVSVEKE